jgi:hypothetical protein
MLKIVAINVAIGNLSLLFIPNTATFAIRLSEKRIIVKII